MDDIIKLLITGICSIIASSGFWLYVQKRSDKHSALMSKYDAQAEMLRGLGHDRIIRHGMRYIEKGFITTSDYENLKDYLYVPYKKLGGNGSADRIMLEIDKLEIRE
jgi:hypothetical protein